METKIGIYDSGIGGVSVLIRLIKDWKGGNYLYLGDNANMPYGSRSEKELFRLAKENVDRLLSAGATDIVLACNTMSMTVLKLIEKYSPVPVFGIVPPDPGRGGAIFGTPNTIACLAKNGVSAALYSLPNLAREIEKSALDLKKLTILDHLGKIPVEYDKIVLGCTHYWFVRNAFAEIFPNAVISDGYDMLQKSLKNVVKTDFFAMRTNVLFFGENSDWNRSVFLRFC